MTVDDQPAVPETPAIDPLAGGPLAEVREGLGGLRESGCPVRTG